jgi:hypothetical protein
MLSGCMGQDDYFGFEKEDYKVIEEVDSHGGFHGDGTYHLILDCGKNKEKALKTISKWDKLPLSKNLEIELYGGQMGDVSIMSDLAKECNVPRIKNGYYYFYDRHSESTDRRDDSELLDRYSENYSLAIYDTDTDRMYFIASDT